MLHINYSMISRNIYIATEDCCIADHGCTKCLVIQLAHETRISYGLTDHGCTIHCIKSIKFCPHDWMDLGVFIG